MEENSRIKTEDIKTELQLAYWEFIKKRAEEYQNRQLTGRLVIDFQKGKINSIFDQGVIAGASALYFYMEKL